MTRGIIKLNGYYLEWSGVCDAPTSPGLTRDAFIAWYKRTYGSCPTLSLLRRLKRADEWGTSYLDATLDDVIADNRAGPEEACLTPEELYQAYCLREPIRDGWKPQL
jgi:hypothetical protein